MVFINEFLPNPSGTDAAEWIELYNSGASPVSVSGWHIETSSGRKTILSGTIAPREYKVLYRYTYKFVLKNTDGSIALYDTKGILVSRAGFSGTATPGKSYSRQADSSFILTSPTPGAPNAQTSALALINDPHPFGTPLSATGISTGAVFLLAAAIGVFLAGVSLYSVKTDENLSKLFFARDEEVGDNNREETCPEPVEGDFAF